MEEIIKAYSEILKVCNKYEWVEWIKDILQKANNYIEIARWKKEYDITLRFETNVTWLRYIDSPIYDHHFIYFTNAQEDKDKWSWYSISWSDDGRQPNNEWLLSISFSTGAFIFWDDYPKELFNELFEELKTYNPKYTDTNNHYLYYSLEDSWKIIKEYKSIMEKYHKRNKEEANLRRIKKLELELEKLKLTK